MCTLLDCGLDFSWTVCPAYSQLQGRNKGAGEENCPGIFQVLEGKKVVLMPFRNTIFQLEDSLHLLLLRAVNMAAVLSLARKKKAHEVHDKMLSRGSIVPFILDLGSTLVSLIICRCSDSSTHFLHWSPCFLVTGLEGMGADSFLSSLYTQLKEFKLACSIQEESQDE